MFTPSRLALARKSRGLSLVRLAEAADITAKSLSKYENAKGAPSPETLQRLAAVLGFPPSFFAASDLDDVPLEAVSFRAASKLPAGKRDAALSLGRQAIAMHEWIGARFRLPAPDLPTLSRFSTVRADQQSGLEGEDHDGPELAAGVVRARWGLGSGPISNMVHLLEAHGVRVSSLTERCAEVDAFSLWWKRTPYVFLNTRKSAERSRFDAAHELGHLVLHGEEAPHGIGAEREAHRFASAFLMPRASVLGHVPRNASPQQVLQAKKYWKVAALALAYRLHDIGLSTDWHYRTMIYQLSKRGYRSSEPSGIARETSQVLDKVFRALRTEGTTPAAIASDLHIHPADLNDLVFGLVVTAVDGNGSARLTPRPKLSVVK
jgi:Zn-dependent peptidase ImmA (M78 family)/transcriptional regulator with XRE-family HTH domain